jgi:hypothetical protein
MKRNLATFTAIAILAIGGWSMAALADDQEAVRLSRQSLGVMQAAGDKVASPVSASSNGTSVFSSIEKASAPKGEDTDSLRLELISCLLVMLAVPAGALLGVCYCDRRATQRKSRRLWNRLNRRKVDRPSDRRSLRGCLRPSVDCEPNTIQPSSNALCWIRPNNDVLT